MEECCVADWGEVLCGWCQQILGSQLLKHTNQAAVAGSGAKLLFHFSCSTPQEAPSYRMDRAIYRDKKSR